MLKKLCIEINQLRSNRLRISICFLRLSRQREEYRCRSGLFRHLTTDFLEMPKPASVGTALCRQVSLA